MCRDNVRSPAALRRSAPAGPRPFERTDAVVALARVVVATETKRGKRFYGAGDLSTRSDPRADRGCGGRSSSASRSGGSSHLLQLRFAVDDDGAVQVLFDTKRPLVRKGDYHKPHVMPKRQTASGE
jgi:hypothetical protein